MKAQTVWTYNLFPSCQQAQGEGLCLGHVWCRKQRGKGSSAKESKLGHPKAPRAHQVKQNAISNHHVAALVRGGGEGHSVGGARASAKMHLEVIHYICPGHRKRYTRSSLIMLQSNGEGGCVRKHRGEGRAGQSKFLYTFRQ